MRVPSLAMPCVLVKASAPAKDLSSVCFQSRTGPAAPAPPAGKSVRAANSATAPAIEVSLSPVRRLTLEEV